MSRSCSAPTSITIVAINASQPPIFVSTPSPEKSIGSSTNAATIESAIKLATRAIVPGGAGPAVYTSGLITFSITAFHLLEGEERKIGIFIALIGTIGMIVGGLQLGREAPARTRVRAPESPPPPPPASPTV